MDCNTSTSHSSTCENGLIPINCIKDEIQESSSDVVSASVDQHIADVKNVKVEKLELDDCKLEIFIKQEVFEDDWGESLDGEHHGSSM